MADSDDEAARAHAASSTTYAVHAMLPNLRLIVSAMIATCAVVLAASAGLIGSSDPSRGFADIPEVSRPLMQKAMMEEPEWQHFQLLAYARRTDELQRLLDLPVTPARAVVEAAEPVEPAEPAIVAGPAIAAEPAVPDLPALAEPEAESGTVQIALQHDALAAPAAAPPPAKPAPADVSAAEAVPSNPPPAAEAVPTEAPTETPTAAPAAETRLANVQPGSVATAVVRLPPKKPKILAKPAPKTKAARAAPRKKKIRRATSAASTSFPVELSATPAQENQNATLFNNQRNR